MIPFRNLLDIQSGTQGNKQSSVLHKSGIPYGIRGDPFVDDTPVHIHEIHLVRITTGSVRRFGIVLRRPQSIAVIGRIRVIIGDAGHISGRPAKGTPCCQDEQRQSHQKQSLHTTPPLSFRYCPSSSRNWEILIWNTHIPCGHGAELPYRTFFPADKKSCRMGRQSKKTPLPQKETAFAAIPTEVGSPLTGSIRPYCSAQFLSDGGS